MPLPKSVDELKALKAIAKKMSSLVKSKKNLSNFEEYATDATSVMGKTMGNRILAVKKAMSQKKPSAEKIAEKMAKLQDAFAKLIEKVDAQVTKVKESCLQLNAFLLSFDFCTSN